MTHISPARLLMLVVVVAVCGAGLLTQVWKRFELYGSPYAETLPWGPGSAPLTERVVICLIDGLRADVSRTMPQLNTLRASGADWALSVTEPTFSIPISHVIMTGAPQTSIGLLHNRTPIGPGFYTTFGNIYTAAREAGLRTGNVVTWSPGYPLQQFLDAPNNLPPAPGYADDDGLVAKVQEVLAGEHAPHLLWVHFDIVDRAGHVAGGASAEYRDTVATTDERIGRIASTLDLTRETLIVTADHGHTDQGGHGGGEPDVTTVPCVLVGAGITPGTSGAGAQGDLASSIAWLLGTPVPTHNEGWPLVDALDMEPEHRARRARDTAAQLVAAYALRLQRLGIDDQKLHAPMPHGLRTELVDSQLERGNWPVALAVATNLAIDLGARWEGWRAKLADDRLRPRMYAASGSALLALGLSIARRRRAAAAGAPPAENPPVWLLGGVALALAVPWAVFLAQGNTYSLSVLGRRGLLLFAAPRMAEGAVGLAAGYVVARLLLQRTAPNLPVGSVIASVSGGIAGVALAGAGVYLVGFGLQPQPWLQDFHALGVFLVCGFQFLGVGTVALLSGLGVAIVSGRDTPA